MKSPGNKSGPELQDWQVKYSCSDCKDEIWSDFAGQYKQCSCGASAVDQTPYYGRVIGKAQLVKRPIQEEDDGYGNEFGWFALD